MLDIVRNIVLVALYGLGLLLFGYAFVVGRGKVPAPRARFWGSAVRMSRRRFRLYFGALGIFFSLTIHLVIFQRDGEFIFAIISGMLVSLVLVGGWIFMIYRERGK